MQENEAEILESIRNQAHKKSLQGPGMTNSFSNVENGEVNFWSDLRNANRRGVVPIGYGLTRREGSDTDYRTLEVLEVGSKANRETRIILPREVWLPRTILWVQALELMYRLSGDVSE